MMIGGDDISYDVITLGTSFSMFVYICTRFLFALIGRNLTAQPTGSHGGIGGVIQIPETKLPVLLPFPAPLPERPGEFVRSLLFLWPSPRDLIPLSPNRELKALFWKYLDYEQDALRALTR